MARIPVEVAAREMAATIMERLLIEDRPLSVELYLFDRYGLNNAEPFFEHFESFLTGHFALGATGEPNFTTLETRSASAILQQLDQRRRIVEVQLVAALREGETLEPFHQQLRQLAELRALYAPESAAFGRTSIVPASVFVSSTFEDLKRYRSRVREVIRSLGMAFIGMEDFEAAAAAPADLICQKVRASSRYVGLLGARYGHVDSASGLSMTELEYSQAVAAEKPIHMFLLDESVPIPMTAMERDPEKLTKLENFRSKVLETHTCVRFTDEDDLARRVELSLCSS